MSRSCYLKLLLTIRDVSPQLVSAFLRMRHFRTNQIQEEGNRSHLRRIEKGRDLAAVKPPGNIISRLLFLSYNVAVA